MQVSVDTLVDYIEQYRPSFRAAIRGASEQEVAELEALVGRPLPPAYRQFLRRMGHDHAGLWLQGPYDMSTLGDMIDHYEAARLFPHVTTPDDCLLILQSDIDGTDLYLCPKRAPEPQVMMSGPTGYHAASLLTLLYSVAFRAHRQEALSTGRYTSSSEDVGGRDVLPEAIVLAEAAGFRRQWFSDRRDFCGEGPGAALYLTQQSYSDQYAGLYSGLYMKVAAETPGEVERFATPFVARFHLHPSAVQSDC